MKRIVLSIIIAATLLAIPLLYVLVFPAPPCSPAHLCESSALEGAAGMFLLPAMLALLPLMEILPERLWMALVFTANLLLYASVIWLWLRRRDRRLDSQPRQVLSSD